MTAWLRKISEKFKDETGAYPTESDLLELEEGVFSFEFTKEMNNLTVPLVDHLGPLIRLHKALDSAGVPDRGRGTEISKVTGYSKPRVSRLLGGEDSMPDRFIITVCNVYGIDKMWVLHGTVQSHIITEPWARDGIPEGDSAQKIEVFDAPTREVINDMQKLNEADRWVFVGRVKPIVRELIENSSKSED